MSKKVTYQDIKRWIKLNEKYSILEISKIVKRNNSIIYKKFKKIGYKPKKVLFNDIRRTFSDGKIIKIYKEYISDNNISINYLSKKYKTTWNTLYKRFHLLFLPTKDIQTVCHNYNINHNFFSKIDSEIKAYLLGFFAADGHVRKLKDINSFSLSINIHHKDSEILNLFNKYIANNKLKFYSNKNQLNINIASKQIGLDLLKLGYNNRKTYTCKSLPKIPKKWMRHFIRGYFDGDGHISLYKYSIKCRTYYTKQFNICAFNKIILKKISNYFPKNIKFYYSKKRKDKINLIIIQGTRSLNVIYKFLYRNAKFYLKRKKDTFKMAIKTASFLRKINYNK